MPVKTNPATGNTNTAPVFSASYIYTPELLHSFVKIHLWYQKRQHPLFLVTPGLFLAGCILWRLFPVFTGAAELSSGKRLEIALMGVFVFFVLAIMKVSPALLILAAIPFGWCYIWWQARRLAQAEQAADASKNAETASKKTENEEGGKR